METVIGCTSREGAQALFSAPAVDGKTFREQVAIYACGTGPYLARLAPAYARKLAGKKDEAYIVWARSFMMGGGLRGPQPGEEPEEFFDVVFCLPVEDLTDEMIESFEETACVGGRGPGSRKCRRGHGPGGFKPGYGGPHGGNH